MLKSLIVGGVFQNILFQHICALNSKDILKLSKVTGNTFFSSENHEEEKKNQWFPL